MPRKKAAQPRKQPRSPAAKQPDVKLSAVALAIGDEERGIGKRVDELFQFKISLLNIEPEIWRRIQIADCLLGDLSDHIQAAFGWDGYHAHAFAIAGKQYEPVSDDGPFDPETLDEDSVHLSDLLPKSRKKATWIYEYDFGDGWRHEIVLELVAAKEKGVKYPLCLAGARACPPEDCGGPWGYADLLDALADPTHERHEEFMEWCDEFDPETFDAAKATREMRGIK